MIMLHIVSDKTVDMDRLKGENIFHMIAKIDMKLDAATDDISYQMASTFHGALMDLLPDDYATELHISKRHPYTQHIERQGKEWHWIITALNEYTACHMLQDVLMQLDEFTIKKHGLIIHVLEKSYQELSDKELADVFYHKEPSRYITVQFVTPTAFKQNGRYVNYPDLRLMFSSIMNKYDASNPDEQMYDEDTLYQLIEKVMLNRYNLRSVSFSMEGVRIPAFIGTITLKMTGTQTMSNFANMLFEFGKYSGIGIKTTLGMGAIKISEEGKKEHAR